MGAMSGALTVLEAGPVSTVQDAGRFGFLRYGVAPAGPCDTLLHTIANRLVGNSIGTASIEVTLKGDRYKVVAESVRIAFAGDFAVEIDGQKAETWRSYTLREGQVLSVGYAITGVRGYLAVAGGFDLTPELGSLSVHIRSGIGPFGGAALKQGATIPLKLDCAPLGAERIFDQSALPRSPEVLRVILGPQDQYFGADELARLSRERFTLTPKCDRMGYQLSGPKFDYRRDLPLISEGVALGSIQVLGDGLFIVALVDRQTVGGYPKIATVIGPDIRNLTQTRPGTTIQFRAIEIAEAQKVSRDYAQFIKSLDNHIRSQNQELSSESLLRANLISGVHFDA
jgi:biotin-dependent carboxylase-like uncharacterized protein